jgi:hypothetical protein
VEKEDGEPLIKSRLHKEIKRMVRRKKDKTYKGRSETKQEDDEADKGCKRMSEVNLPNSADNKNLLLAGRLFFGRGQAGALLQHGHGVIDFVELRHDFSGTFAACGLGRRIVEMN